MELPSLMLPNDGLSKRLVSTCIGTLLASTSCVAFVAISLSFSGSDGRYPASAALALGICLPSISIVIRCSSSLLFWRLSFIPIILFALLFLIAGSGWLAPGIYLACVVLVLLADFKWPMRSVVSHLQVDLASPVDSTPHVDSSQPDDEPAADVRVADDNSAPGTVLAPPDTSTVITELSGGNDFEGGDFEEEYEEEGEPLPANASQQLTRLFNDGADVAEGMLRAKFEEDSRQCSMHVALCPAMERSPRVELFQLDGPEATLTLAESKPYGLRIDVRLTAAASGGAEVLIHFSAACE